MFMNNQVEKMENETQALRTQLQQQKNSSAAEHDNLRKLCTSLKQREESLQNTVRNCSSYTFPRLLIVFSNPFLVFVGWFALDSDAP